MEILLAGDLVPTKVNFEFFDRAKVDVLLGQELLDIWNMADIRVFNLETPLTDNSTPISKRGPNLKAPISTLNGINALNPSLITLANNHILDYGKEGLDSTLDSLSKNNIPNIGAGANLTEASKPYIFQCKSKKIGLYACAENEFSIATEETAGANPFEPLESLDHIKLLKEQCDYLIVLYHGGKEHYRYPSPNLQKITRKIAEKGADLVVCQHSHCIGCFEEYKNSTIIYGQGNFIFNKYDNEFWNTSLLIKLIIDDTVKIDYIPIKKTKLGTRLAEKNDADKILKDFYKRSSEILDGQILKKKYKELANISVGNYLRQTLGLGKWLSRFDRFVLKGALVKMKYRKKHLLGIQNYIECEAHRELFLAGIKELTKNGGKTIDE